MSKPNLDRLFLRYRSKGDTAFARIPTSRIKSGDYIVTLKGLNSSQVYDTVAEYSFSIDRK